MNVGEARLARAELGALGGKAAEFLFEVSEFAAQLFGGDEACRIVFRTVDSLAGGESLEGRLRAVGVALDGVQPLLIGAADAWGDACHAAGRGIRGKVSSY